MFQDLRFEQGVVPCQRELLPSLEHLLLRELRQIQQQSQLLQRLAGDQKNSLICDSTIEWESERENEEDSFELSGDRDEEEEEEEVQKISLLLDCRLKRMREDEDILAEIQRKCSKKCADRVKTVFSLSKQHSVTIKQLQKELNVSKSVNESLLAFKEENLSLKQRLATAELKLAQFDEINSKGKRLEERLAVKEKGLLKLERTLMEKEKRLVNMRIRVQDLFEVATHRGEDVMEAIEQYNNQLGSLTGYECIDDIVKKIHQQANVVSEVWHKMATSLEKI